MRPTLSFEPNQMDEIIRRDFQAKVDRAIERFKASIWFGSGYAGTSALMAFLADEIPEKYDWEPVAMGSNPFPMIILTGYNPTVEEVLKAPRKLPRSVN